MSSKRHLHYILKRLKQFHYAYFVVLIVMFGWLSLVSLRQNNQTAIELRDKLLEVDRQNGDVETALRELRTFTYQHMNANLRSGPNGVYPPIQLKYRYERLVQAEKDRVQAVNSQIYIQAQQYCERRITGGAVANRIPCIQEYVTNNGGATEKPIEDALYKFDFVSPIWSPDRAGWSLVALAVTCFALLTRLVSELWLRYRMNNE